ncbi:phage protein Gp36 family protein [Stappia sp.]|uniref:phage protein Gp36 family protein n=1 Tax=Stappia sp. TaxID=1870903 RepID=UPI003A99A178
MAYASKTDIETLWGADFLSDLLPEDVDVDAAIATALRFASAEIDAHLSARYELPLADLPEILIAPAANIAVYVAANQHASLTTTIEERYKHAVELLKRIAEGKAGLGSSEPVIAIDGAASDSGAAFFAEPRVWGRRQP